jgi:NTP pyrophosphatase (non-canonical NTP hydrolase)
MLNEKMEFEKFKKFNEDFLEIQIKLNDEMFPVWKNELNEDNFYDAIIVETGECLDSLAYKWWKYQEKDLENAKVEIIDLLHFVLSQFAYNKKELFENAIEIAWNACYKDDKNSVETDTKIHLRKLVKEDLSERLKNLYKSAQSLQMKFEEIYKMYVIKNVLNLFRMKNGYKEGTYIKIWKNEEDNVWSNKFAKEIEFDLEFKNNLYKKLQEFYDNEIK